MSSPRRLARLTGALYLTLAVLGGFAQLGVRAAMFVPGDPTATAANVAADPALLRLALVADLVQMMIFLLVGLNLARLFEPVDRYRAHTLLAFVVVSVSVMCANLAFHAAVLLLATDPAYAAAQGQAANDALVYLMLDLHAHGYLLVEMFFGVWLLPMGLLVRASKGMAPRWLGTLLVVGAAGYVVHLFAKLLLPELGGAVEVVVTAPAVAAELCLAGWLLVKGVAAPEAERERTTVAAV